MGDRTEAVCRACRRLWAILKLLCRGILLGIVGALIAIKCCGKVLMLISSRDVGRCTIRWSSVIAAYEQFLSLPISAAF